MSGSLRYVQIGVGGFGQHWCTEVLPRLKTLGLAEAVAAVDINPEVLPQTKEQLGLNGDEAPPNKLEDNIQCAAFLFAAVESAHTGRVVHVQRYLREHLDRAAVFYGS